MTREFLQDASVERLRVNGTEVVMHGDNSWTWALSCEIVSGDVLCVHLFYHGNTSTCTHCITWAKHVPGKDLVSQQYWHAKRLVITYSFVSISSWCSDQQVCHSQLTHLGYASTVYWNTHTDAAKSPSHAATLVGVGNEKKKKKMQINK